MAWSRRGLKGMNADDPTSSVKQGPGSHISETGVIGSLVNHKNKPGAFNLSDLDDVYFNGVNIVSNGDFGNAAVTDTATGPLHGWSSGGTHSGTNHFTISDGALNITRGNGTVFYIYQTILVPSGTYTYSVNVTTIGNGVSFWVGNAALDDLSSAQVLSAGINTGTIITNDSAINFIIYPGSVNGITILDDIVLTPDNKHVIDNTNGSDFGFFGEDNISRWFRDDGSTTT